jgi:phosphoribosylglycinamide formyltransferase-1
MNIVILASGRGSNARALFECEKKGMFADAKIVGLICDIEDAPVFDVAKEYGIEALHLPTLRKGARFSEEASANYQNALKNWNADLVVLAGFMKILPPDFVEAYANKMINLHPSLLPDFKGKDAIKQAFDAGVKVCGCSVHFVNNELDGGEVIAQKKVEILPEDTLESLEEKVHKAEHQLLPQIVADIVSGKIAIG